MSDDTKVSILPSEYFNDRQEVSIRDEGTASTLGHFTVEQLEVMRDAFDNFLKYSGTDKGAG